MKNLLLVFIIIILITGCKKDNPINYNESDNRKSEYTRAIITGTDPRMTPCSGGLMVNFTNNPKPFGDEFYQWFQNNNTLAIDPNNNSQFPLYVDIKYYKTDNNCFESKGEIEITDLKKL